MTTTDDSMGVLIDLGLARRIYNALRLYIDTLEALPQTARLERELANEVMDAILVCERGQ